MCYHLIIQKEEGLIMNNTELFNVLQNAVSDAANDKISISNISSYTSNNNTCGIKFLATKSGVPIPFFFGFSTDKKYLDYVVFGILNSDRNENIDKISLDEDNSKNLIQDKFKFKKILSKEESVQIKKLSKWLNDEIKGFFILFKMFNKELFENEIEDSAKNEPPVKEKNKTNKEIRKQEEESYDDISSETWIKIVEFPWMIILLGCGVFFYGSFIENPTETKINLLLGLSMSLTFIGIIAVLATIGKKKKIREALGLEITINPYSWFISKIGKVLCGTLCFCFGFGLIFLLSAFKDTVFSSGSSSGSSSRGSPASSRTAHSSNNTSSSSSSISYYCKYCGRKYSSISMLTSCSCPNHPNGSGRHSPYQGDEKSSYYCKYCGRKYSSISMLTSCSCPNHPNGSGRYAPAI